MARRMHAKAKTAVAVKHVEKNSTEISASEDEKRVLNPVKVDPAAPRGNGDGLVEPRDALGGASGAPKKHGRRRKVIVCIAVVAAVCATALYYLLFVAPFESTDDAFIEADATPIAPQVAGQVVRLLVNDNQDVNAGDLLLEIDPRIYQARVDQTRASLAAARSSLEQARALLSVDLAKVDQEKASVIATEAQAKFAAADFQRYRSVGALAVSKSQLDLSGTQDRSSAAEVDVARNRELAAEAQAKLDQANIATAAARVELNEADVRQTELDLSYTRVTAPLAGFVTHRTVDNGAYVQPGQDLLAIMPRQVWVVANFKENQLAHMRPGQSATMRIDAYPQTTFKGHVDSIQAGTGARFSLLPPENATGNYVKVVQRVPVKILLDDIPETNYVFGAGMSVVPKVRVK
jgi:membrane fusion protein, multidrug efflux system